MNTLRLATLTLAVALGLNACNDDEDRISQPQSAGGKTSGQAGSGSETAGVGGSDDQIDSSGGEAGATTGGSDAAGGSDTAGGAAGAPAASGAGGDAAGAGGGPALEPFELIGEWSNNFGSDELISAESWNTSRVADYDNERNVVYTQLPADDAYNPNKFTKILYTEPASDSFYYCWVEFSLDTLEAAKASLASADPSDPDNGGCGGSFPWTKATKK
jgi:hypothetical protein